MSQRKGRPKAVPKLYRHGYERERLQIDVGDETITQQSFRDSCDVNKIIDLHARTGLVQHLNPAKPQYGDMPDSDLFEAACAQAAIRSAEEEGFEWASEPSESPESEADPQPKAEDPQADTEALEAPQTATEG